METIDYSNPSQGAASHRQATRNASFIRAGGGLGIAGCCIGLAIFFLACAGFDAVLPLSIIPMAMGLPGMVLTLIGGTRKATIEDTATLAALFVNSISIAGGLLEFAAWRQWTIFPGSGSGV